MGLFGPPDVQKMRARKNVKGLIKSLSWEDYEVREAAALALGGIGDDRAIEPLIGTLKDDYYRVRAAAARALQRLGWEPDGGEAEAWYWVARGNCEKARALGALAVEPLIIALKAGHYRVGEAAAQALGEIGDNRAVEPLIKALKYSSSSRGEAAAKALGEIGDARAVEPLIEVLKDSGLSVREAAAQALVRIGSPAVEPLIEALKHRDGRVHKAAAEALELLGWEPDGGEDEVWYWIAKEEWAKVRALGALAVEPLILAFRDYDYDVREAAAQALAEIGDARAAEPLREALKDRHYEIREAAAEALELLGWEPDGGEDEVWYWIAKEEWAKAGTLGALAVEPLIVALKDAKFSVRYAAAEALGEIGDNRAVEPLIDRLGSRLSWEDRRTAATVLVTMYEMGLDPQSTQRILAQRNVITSAHSDHQERLPSGCVRPHEDNMGVGVDFPL